MFAPSVVACPKSTTVYANNDDISKFGRFPCQGSTSPKPFFILIHIKLSFQGQRLERCLHHSTDARGGGSCAQVTKSMYRIELVMGTLETIVNK